MTWNIATQSYDVVALLGAAGAVLTLFPTYAVELGAVPIAERVRASLEDRAAALRAADLAWREDRAEMAQVQAEVETAEAGVRAAYAALRGRLALARSQGVGESIGRFGAAVPPVGKLPQGLLVGAVAGLLAVARQAPTALALVGVGPAHLDALGSAADELAALLAARTGETQALGAASKDRELARDALVSALRQAVELLQVALPPRGIGELESIGAQFFPAVRRSSEADEEEGVEG